MRLDCHTHTIYGEVNKDEYVSRLHKAGLDGGVVLSHPPSTMGEKVIPSKQRIENVMEWTKGEKYLFPFFWIDPTSDEAMDDVDLAASMGIKGFKVICSTHYPCDPRAMAVYKKIAKKNLPLLFHSGILYDGKNASGNYNKPTQFEGLLSVDGLKFAMAHVSWPWNDECLAVYGKFQNSLHHSENSSATAEMFLDTTPGTPPNYRKGLLEKLLKTGFDIENNIIWGVDSYVNDYSTEYALEIQKRDDGIFEELGVSKELRDKIYYKNTLRFLGVKE
jgi:predicted TIM-barrel fold metal-dependent hydrolase